MASSTARPRPPGPPEGVSNLLQTGLIKDYALAFLIGAVLFLGFLLM